MDIGYRESEITSTEIGEYSSIPFEDFPASSETFGKGRHIGATFRTMDCVALGDDGREHHFTLRWRRMESPSAVLKRRLDAAVKKHEQLAAQEAPRNMAKYAERLKAADKRITSLADQYRQAKRKADPAPADRLKLVDHGVTHAQREKDAQAREERNNTRPSAPFIRHILNGTGVAPNATQWEIIADFVEGERQTSPFYFMSPSWVPVLERAGALDQEENGLRANGEKLRKAFQDFVKATEA